MLTANNGIVSAEWNEITTKLTDKLSLSLFCRGKLIKNIWYFNYLNNNFRWSRDSVESSLKLLQCADVYARRSCSQFVTHSYLQ